ncbi:uncharacterized protein RAG0_12120 [Rhynchosporium agropyri]|uniref:Uncharacterized protein n=3 Tax=Rhynchosporium TaxID=38037 RepID=A0A1E1LUB1_RHYSE|nr:uncharacterized protein RCO7_00073 [Rhynchosporium commune]CZT06396.1 uncharacterized protein RAG0_12120 [Rhynchosporium agropyri]CZT40052.1 uncharacterized protein RSE6_00090 [Rhynchosporium secalis]
MTNGYEGYRPLRVIIRALVDDIPGPLSKRVNYLAQTFSLQMLHRPFSHRTPKLHSWEQGKRIRDAMHFLTNWDSVQYGAKAWFIYDYNVVEPLTEEEVMKSVPHYVCYATREENTWVFSPRRLWLEDAKRVCSKYKWGAEMPEVETEVQSKEGEEDSESSPEPLSEQIGLPMNIVSAVAP